MKIAIEHDSSTAPYDQLRQQIIEQVHGGGLIAGTKIPTVPCIGLGAGIGGQHRREGLSRAQRSGRDRDEGESKGRFIASGTDPVQAQAEQAATAFAHKVRSLGVLRH